MGDIMRVGVVGAGLMGSGIAEVCARAGLDVVVREIDGAAAAAGQARIDKSLDRALTAGKLTAGDRDTAIGRLAYTTSLTDLADANLVIEAATENPDAQGGLVRRVGRRGEKAGCHPGYEHLLDPDCGGRPDD